MKKITLLLSTLILLAGQIFSQQYQKTENGIKANLQSMEVEIKFYSPSIVRVFRTLEDKNIEKTSLSVIKIPGKTELNISGHDNIVILSSKLLSVSFNMQTGKITYSDSKGNQLLTEKDYGAQFTPTMDIQKQSYTVRQAFMLDKTEAIYGLGQQQNGKLIQRGERIILKNENMKICIPYFLSIKGYGVYWDNYASTVFTDNIQETSFESFGDCIDYYFMYGGTPNGVIPQMRDLTGQAPMFPLWTYGYWQSRERYKSQFEAVDVVKKYRELKVPIDGIIQDWQYWGDNFHWSAMEFLNPAFPDPQKMIDEVHSMHAHMIISVWASFGPETKQYEILNKKGMLLNFDTWPLCQFDIWPPDPKYPSGVKVYDAYDPEARNIYWEFLNKGIFSLGMDGWWLDSSEPDHLNVKNKDYDQPTFLGSYRSVVNVFPLMHVKGVYEHQRAATSDKRVFILARSAFAGQQRFAATSWSGDVRGTWDVLGKQIPAALNFSLCGIPYWNSDIGGFFTSQYKKDGGAKDPEFQELYVRWLQFAAFTPMMRSHGTDIPREIYQFGKPGDWAYDAIKKYINFRYRLLPYLYLTAWEVTSQSGSIIYALPLLFKDEKVQDIKNEFMFGSSILVAPVIKPMYTDKKENKIFEDFSQTKDQKVYLPEGTEWFDFWTGKKLKGGQEITRQSPIDIIPLYVKAGTILPWGPKVQYSTEKNWDPLEIRIYAGAIGEFTLYEDENDNYDYEKGKYSTISMKWDEQSRILTIGERKGSFPGMLKSREFKIVLVTEKSGLGLNEETESFKSVKYNGEKLIVNID